MTTRTIRRTVEHGVRQVSELGGKGEALALMREQRDHEKQELIQLNDRFSNYLDRVKYLEQTNKQLQNTLDQLRSKWGFDSDRFKSQFEPQLNDLRKTIDLATVDKAKAEIRAKRAEFDLIYYKKLSDDISQWTNQDKLKINSLQSTIEENQRELEHLQRLMQDLMQDIDKYRNEMKHLYEEISRLLIELDHETMARIKIENEKQTLEEQIPFLSAIHEQEMNELRNLSSPNIGIDPTTFYKNELQRAIREIRNDFENLSRSQRSELEEYYRIKTDEIIQQAQKQKQQQNNQLVNQENSNQIRISINETKKEMFDLQQDYNKYLQQMSQLESRLETLKRENGDVIDAREREILELRSRLNELMASYDEIVSNKSSLEFEINTYRRLLESEEAHVKKTKDISSTTIHHKITSTTTFPTPSPPSKPITIIPDTKINQTEMQAKTTFQRSAKGPINIDECSPDGKYIQLANTSKNKDIDLTGWRLLRKVDNSPEITYSLPANFKLASGKYLKIHAKGQGKEKTPFDLVLPTHDSWGVGVSVVTRLLNEQNEEKATHIQKTVYAN
jgi:intermediate filament protein if